MKGTGDRVSARSAALVAAAVVLAEIAATPVVGAGLSGRPGVHGSFVPVGALIVDGCVVAIALIVIWARPRNAVGWLMPAVAALGPTQNLTEAYGVRAEAIPGAHLPLGPLALSLGTSLWIPAAALPATLLLNLYPAGHVTARPWTWVNRVTLAAMAVATVAAGTSRQFLSGDMASARPVVALPGPAGQVLLIAGAVTLLACALASIGGGPR